MNTSEFDPSGPPLFPISSNDWWVKVLEMLQHNWALIEERNGKFTVYFFHDEGTTKCFPKGYTLSQIRNRCAVVDSLEFDSLEGAQDALRRNHFERLEENPGSWDGCQPHGNFYDARGSEEGIYSKAGYWIPSI
jgi:hypothetical protein